MFRKVRFLVVMFAALSTAPALVPTDAWAATKTEIKAQKQTLKTVKKDLKTFQKLRKKWEKGVAKGKDVSKVDAEIESFVTVQLNALRRRGVSSKASKSKEGTDTWVERFRNALVAVRNAKSEGRQRNQMAKVEEFLQKRVERAERKLDKLKG